MKLKVQAQHLQPGDVVGSGEVVARIIRNAISLPSNKCFVYLEKGMTGAVELRIATWGKYTMINVERPSAISNADLEHIEGELEDRNRE